MNKNPENRYDVLFQNARIFTSDQDYPEAEVLAVKDGKVAFVGSQEEFLRRGNFSEAAEVIDCGGKRMLPGLVDAHMHAIRLAGCCKQISVLPPLIHSMAELMEEIKKVRSRQTAEQWIEGWGYDEGKLLEGRAPNRYDLDSACSDAPVLLLRSCGHMCAVNSKVLEMAAIDRNTPDPQGGAIGRDENGEPDGLLYERAMNLVTDLRPEPTVEDMADNLLDLDRVLLSTGITAASDMGEGISYDYRQVYGRAIEKGMHIRVAGYYKWEQVKDKKDFKLEPADMDPSNQFRAAGIKLIGDGSVSGRTAWCDVPYLKGTEEDGQEYGMPVCTIEEIDEALEYCKNHGCQLSIHVMGAAAIDRAVERTWQEKPWLDSDVPSVRLEHVAMPTAKAIRRCAAAGIGWATQPVFLYAEIESYLKNLGPERARECYPIADWKDAGVRFCFSTDAPATSWATPSDPWVCIKGAVTRRAWEGTDCGQRHRADTREAIRLYTAEAGTMLGFTHIGKLKEGYAADFILLDRDVLQINPEGIDQVQVEKTFMGGKLVYQRE
ncbi:MAG: amidohydrolase [Firmicutes bacterium]|nr:amidohydrolase [Bacillota bacterium]